MAYTKYTKYSKYHPANLADRPQDPLPTPIECPPAIVTFSETEIKFNGAWGHELCCEKAFGMNETRPMLKGDVTPKIGAGGGWSKTKMVERGTSTCCSAMYAGSLVPMSCCQAADRVCREPRTRHAATQHIAKPILSILLLAAHLVALVPASQGVGSLKR